MTDYQTLFARRNHPILNPDPNAGDEGRQPARSPALRDFEGGGPLRALDAEGRGRAFDLLGLEPGQRLGRTPLDPPPGGDPAAHQGALIAAEVAALERLKAEGLDSLDAMDRT